MQGKLEEAKALDQAQTTASMASDNQTYFKALLTPGRSWERLRGATSD